MKTKGEKSDMSQILFKIPFFFLLLLNNDLIMEANLKMTYVTSKAQLKILYPMEE